MGEYTEIIKTQHNFLNGINQELTIQKNRTHLIQIAQFIWGHNGTQGQKLFQGPYLVSSYEPLQAPLTLIAVMLCNLQVLPSAHINMWTKNTLSLIIKQYVLWDMISGMPLLTIQPIYMWQHHNIVIVWLVAINQKCNK